MKDGRKSTRRAGLAIGLGLSISMLAPLAMSQGPATSPSASSPAMSASAPIEADAAPVETDELDEEQKKQITKLREMATNIDALRAGELDVAIEPESLFTPFSFALSDSRAVQTEIQRLQSIVRDADGQPTEAADAGQNPDAGDGGTDDDAGALAMPPDMPEALWKARLTVDRARLAFLSLPAEERKTLLDGHAERQAEAKPPPREKKLTEAELKAEEAKTQQRKALEDLERAKTQTAKRIITERARLFGVSKEQAAYESKLLLSEGELDEVVELGITWQARVVELQKRRLALEASEGEADALYDELVAHLRGTVRPEAARALADFESRASEVPSAGDELVSLEGADVDRSALDEIRAEVVRREAELKQKEALARYRRAEVTMAQLSALNQSRLELYKSLSHDKRSALVAFSPVGIAQARAELTQIGLVVRYHADLATHARTSLALRGGATSVFATLSVLKILGALVAFIWWRRRAPGVLERQRTKLNQPEGQKHKRPRGRALRLVSFLQKTHRPLEWLGFIWLVVYLLGPEIAGLLEVRIPTLVLTWILCGSLAVSSVNALAARRTIVGKHKDTGVLRLRTLRLIGRVVVAFGLVLSLSAELVGKGTIYAWVFSTCWLAAAPLALVAVRWWRPVIFERIEARKRKSAVAEWVFARQSGWASFVAATVGGAYLFALGAYDLASGYVSGFQVTRRLLAYLFRRNISKQAKERESSIVLEPLADSLREALDPERPSKELVHTVADADLKDVTRCIDAPGGGVFAVVGERGSGKTTLLRRLASDRSKVLAVTCDDGGLSGLRAGLCAALGLDAGASDDEMRTAVDALGDDAALLIDDTHRLVQPIIGGLGELDELLNLARIASRKVTWVLAFSLISWRFVERARGAQPLFNEVVNLHPWPEESIAELLTQRSEEAGIDPSYDTLLAADPDDDDPERQSKLDETAHNYHRLLWDYSIGNPAISLHFWRDSLQVDGEGRHVVQLFSAPPTDDLERLPDPAVFTLRAVVQLEQATTDAIVAATQLPARQVQEALRYAYSRGYLERAGDAHRVRWGWFRAITSFLRRRHLVAGPTL